MIVKPQSYKRLIAVSDGRLHRISYRVMRKTLSYKTQKKKIPNGSICIVCDYRFRDKKIKRHPNIKAICHPFKDISAFPENIKKFLFSESDFCSNFLTPVSVHIPEWDNAGYDFVYFTLLSRQGVHCKGLYLLPLIDEAAGELGLKGLVINYSTYSTKKHNDNLHRKIYRMISSRWKKFSNLKCQSHNFNSKKVCAIMSGCRFVLFPNNADASPRILAEALVRNRPVVVNSSIYGGWKYVNKDTGRFFDAPSLKEFSKGNSRKDYKRSLVQAMKEVLLLDNSKISDNFYESYGFINSSKTLAQIINSVTGKNYVAVAFRDWKTHLKKAAQDEGWI